MYPSCIFLLPIFSDFFLKLISICPHREKLKFSDVCMIHSSSGYIKLFRNCFSMRTNQLDRTLAPSSCTQEYYNWMSAMLTSSLNKSLSVERVVINTHNYKKQLQRSPIYYREKSLKNCCWPYFKLCERNSQKCML